MPLSIKRGTNISHWLSQSERRGAERKAFFTRDDIKRLADWGFDHIRLPIDEEQMWDVDGKQEREAFGLMESALDWCEQSGLKVVVDLHILRSHHFISAKEPLLFTDPAEAEKFADLWHQLSVCLERRSTDRVAYELLNETVAKDNKDWNRVAHVAFQAIREREPRRTIVLGSNRWNSVKTFDELDVPNDPNTILTFHYYRPMMITHYQAPWWPDGTLYNGPLQYPGQPIPAAVFAQLPEETRTRLAAHNAPHDRRTMVADLAKPLAVAQRTGLTLFCGEFGVHDKAPLPVRQAWYRDLISVFKEYGIAWANWDYKGSFALVKDGKSTGIAEAMLG